MNALDKIAEIVREYDWDIGNDGEVADAILAALPDMIPDLVWVDLYGDGSKYEVTSDHPTGFSDSISKRANGAYFSWHGAFDTLDEAKAPANAHHKAQLAKAMGWTV